MNSKRRNFLRGLMTAAGAATAANAYAQHEHPAAPRDVAPRVAPPAGPVPPDQLGPGVVPVVTPDAPDMPWRLDDGVKVFEIAAEHVRTEFVPGRIVDAWGFNGSVPGPTIQVNEGDRVRLVVENRLPRPRDRTSDAFFALYRQIDEYLRAAHVSSPVAEAGA